MECLPVSIHNKQQKFATCVREGLGFGGHSVAEGEVQ
jgi:hypothetical protein